MSDEFYRLATLIWLAWGISWHIAFLWRDKPSSSASRASYRWQLAAAFAGVCLLLLPWPPGALHLWRTGPALGWWMIALTLAGFGFTWWARIHLGKLWSGGVERMANHRVVDSGPYGLVRHPIYTGLIAAAAALAIIRATPLAIVGALLFSLGFALKAKVEERFLEAELGGYEQYRARVPMILPFTRFIR